MALTVSVFVFCAVVTFTVVMLFTRPSATARAVERRLAGVQMASNGDVPNGDGAAELLKQTNLSEIKWLNKLLEGWGTAQKISLLLAQSESSWSVSTVLFASAILGVMGFAIVRYWIADPAPGLIAGILATAFPVLILRAKRERRLTSFNQKLPDALDLIARALRAGHSISAAIEIVAEEGAEPLRSEFGEVYKQQNFGIPQRDALLQLGRRVPSADLQIVITAMLVQKETGGNLVEILGDHGGAARPYAHPGRVARAHGPGPAYRLDPMPAAGGYVLSDQRCQSRLYQRSGARPGGDKAYLYRHRHDGNGRIVDPQNRQDQSVSP